MYISGYVSLQANIAPRLQMEPPNNLTDPHVERWNKLNMRLPDCTLLNGTPHAVIARRFHIDESGRITWSWIRHTTKS